MYILIRTVRSQARLSPVVACMKNILSRITSAGLPASSPTFQKQDSIQTIKTFPKQIVSGIQKVLERGQGTYTSSSNQTDDGTYKYTSTLVHYVVH